MKQNKWLSIFLILGCIFVFMNTPAMAQKSKKEKTKKEHVKISDLKLDSLTYVFEPQIAMPSKGRVRNLNYDFQLVFKPKELICYLPYYGEAYSGAGYNVSENPLDFTSKKFVYSISEKKKGQWDITLKFQDLNDLKEMYLTIFENGSASLQTVFNNHSGISFNGNFREMKNKVPVKDKDKTD